MNRVLGGDDEGCGTEVLHGVKCLETEVLLELHLWPWY